MGYLVHLLHSLTCTLEPLDHNTREGMRRIWTNLIEDCSWGALGSWWRPTSTQEKSLTACSAWLVQTTSDQPNCLNWCTMITIIVVSKHQIYFKTWFRMQEACNNFQKHLEKTPKQLKETTYLYISCYSWIFNIYTSIMQIGYNNVHQIKAWIAECLVRKEVLSWFGFSNPSPPNITKVQLLFANQSGHVSWSTEFVDNAEQKYERVQPNEVKQ